MGSRSFTSDRDCIIQNASCNNFLSLHLWGVYNRYIDNELSIGILRKGNRTNAWANAGAYCIRIAPPSEGIYCGFDAGAWVAVRLYPPAGNPADERQWFGSLWWAPGTVFCPQPASMIFLPLTSFFNSPYGNKGSTHKKLHAPEQYVEARWPIIVRTSGVEGFFHTNTGEMARFPLTPHPSTTARVWKKTSLWIYRVRLIQLWYSS